MKKTISSVFAGSLMAAGLACAQTGLIGGQDGMHQVSAHTLGQWGFAFGVGGNMSLDNWSLAAGGFMNYKKQQVLLNNVGVSMSAELGATVGLTNWMDLGVSIPLYMDYASDKNGLLQDNGMSDIAAGDLNAWAKFQIVGDDKSFFNLAIQADFWAPTGAENAGIRPRHVWYLNWKTKAYTADEFVAGLSGIISLDWDKVRWNTKVGYVQPFDMDDQSGAVVYSTGVNISPNKFVDVFLELSGEAHIWDMRSDFDMMADPMILTPGARFHLGSNVDLSLGIDVGARVFKNLDFDCWKDLEDQEVIKTQDNRGRTFKYAYAPNPLFAGSAALTWRFGGYAAPVTVPAENDSLVKVLTEQLAQANAALDKANGRVDTVSVTKTDTVSVAKTDTVSVTKTDTVSVAKTDTVQVKDAASEDAMKAQLAAANAKVDSLSRLTADDDNDGVANMSDKCAETPAGMKVGADGCEVDTDKDGVVDSKDKCPESVPGSKVGEDGCELDDDKDGVIDMKDECPNTLSNVKVNAKGCPVSKNEDLTKLQAQIKFGKGKKGEAKLAKSSNKALDQIAKLVLARNGLRINVYVHSDEKGDDADENLALTQKRADAIVAYLVDKKGVPSGNINAVAKGSTELVVQPKPAKKGKKVKSNKQNVRVVVEPAK